MAKHEVDKLVKGFLEYMEVERGCSKLTVRNYKHYLSRFGEWYKDHVGTKDLSKLDLEVMRKYRLFLSRLTNHEGNSIAKVTQNYHVIALRSFLKWLAKQDIEILAPEKIELPKAESKSLKFLTVKQTERLLGMSYLDDEKGMRDRAILEMLFSTGLRVSEVSRLDREKIDFETREFGIIGKGGRARVVFMSDRAAIWLKKYFDSREDDWKPAFIRYSRGKIPEKPDGEDMRLTVRSIQRIVEKYRRRAKLPVDITPHGLRHTFATDLLSAGAGLREVQEMLGHKNVATTQIYTHVTNPQLKRIHKKFHSGNEKGGQKKGSG